LQGTLIDKDGLIIVKRCAIPSTNLLEGADFEDAAGAFWEQSSTGELALIKTVSEFDAYDGMGVAILGGEKGTTDVLEQMIAFPQIVMIR